jgi:hypothetical protein
MYRFIVISMLAVTANADVVYQISVNTSSITGTPGSVDINFNPGPSSTQAALVQISGFSSDGMLAENCPCGTGDVSGQLTGIVTIGNSTGFNDYFDGFLYGTILVFDVTFSGPAITTPDGTSTSGSSLVFSMFSDPAGTIPALTTDAVNGFALRTDLNPDGTVTLINFSPQITITAPASPVPEPSTLLSTLTMLALAVFVAHRRKSRLLPRWETQVDFARFGRGAHATGSLPIRVFEQDVRMAWVPRMGAHAEQKMLEYELAILHVLYWQNGHF